MILVTKISGQARQRGHTLSTCVCVCVRVCVCVCVILVVCVCVCVCVFIKLHITTQSGPVILVILCHSH